MALLRGNTHSQFFTPEKVWCDQIFPPTPENVRCDQTFLCSKTLYKGTTGNRATAEGLSPKYYIMITLFKRTRKYYSQNNKLIHLASHMALQVASLISTTIVTRNRKFLSVSCDYGTTEPSNSVPGSSDRHAQRLTMGSLKII